MRIGQCNQEAITSYIECEILGRTPKSDEKALIDRLKGVPGVHELMIQKH